MFRYILLAALTGALFLTSTSTFAAAANHAARPNAASTLSTPDPVVFDDGPGLGGGY